MSQAGFRTIVLEVQPLHDLGQDTDIFHMDEVRFDEFDLPLPAGEELIGHHATGLAWSPDLEVQNEVRYGFYVMHKPAFHQRMHRYVLEAGGEILERTEGTEPIVEHGFLTGVRNPSRGTGAILGIGQPGSYDHAWRKHREWREEYFDDPGRVVKRTQGRTPYRRSPFSLVANGFMVMGDAAFQTKPFSGEGVTSSFTACRIAAEVAVEALRAQDVSREALWPYNVRYFRDQGAKFASMFVQLRRLLAVSATAGRIKEHYRQFPDDPAEFEAWVAAVRPLWGET
jgi:flavin-dependent dehydrogenase